MSKLAVADVHDFPVIAVQQIRAITSDDPEIKPNNYPKEICV